ncbi:hypothetical protein [Bradyrhizobium sp. NC92]|nr:hypothetical protein [Bradyrhizobium sp. NC92]UWU66217.1 hypothetical protein N2602_23535 [Bradyrhizobium sp. NC92]
MDSEKRPPSCTDQFDKPVEPKSGSDRWVDGFMKRLIEVLDRIAGKK